VATMMARQGPLLFGQRFDVSPERLQQWDRATRGQTPQVAVAIKFLETDARTDGLPPAVRVAGAK
jgi:hypothetical protein